MIRWIALPRNLVWLVASLFSTLAVAAAVRPICEPDVWWVAAAGRELLRTHAVPTQNLFSFVEPAHPWVMHEWLFGPLYALGLEYGGPAFFAAIALLAFAAQVALVLAGTVGRARHPTAGLLLAFVALLCFGSRFLSARPTGVALLLPLAMTMLAFAPAFGARSAVLAVGVELTWANAHGSFPLGVVLLLAGALEQRRDRRRRLAASAAAALVTMVNPYGWALYRFVWDYARGTDGIYRAIHAHIEEFGNVVREWGATVRPLDALGLVLVGALAIGATLRPSHRVRGFLCLGLLAAACVHARHVELAGLIGCLLLVPVADDCVAAWGLPAPAADWPRSATRLVLASTVSLGVAAFVLAAVSRSPERWIAPEAPPLALIDAVPDGAHVVAPFAWSGMIIWYGFPRSVRVFYDSRNDCYSAGTFETFLAFDAAHSHPERAREGLDSWGADAVLVSQRGPLARHLDHERDWVLAASTDSWRLYRRTAPSGDPVLAFGKAGS
jgi:hypothetical protein